MEPTRNQPEVFFKYIGPGGLKAVLADRSVRFGDPRLFNDPFDLQTDLRYGFSGDEFEDALTKEVVRIAFSPDAPELDPARSVYPWVVALRERARRAPGTERQIELAARVAVKTSRARLDELVSRANQRWHDWLSGIRVFCASEVNDSLLMWSHYAKSHKGAVLALRAISRLGPFLLAAGPVSYQDHFPVLGTLEDRVKRATAQRVEDAFENYLLVKSDCWAYEREWRAFATAESTGNPYRYCEFAPEELEAVYLGCRIAPEDRDEVTRLVRRNFPEARIFQGTKSAVQFAVEFQEVGP